MSVNPLIEAGWMRPHRTNAREIGNLWSVAVRDLDDAAHEATARDIRFELAFNAAVKFCIILLYAAGVRPDGRQAVHQRILKSLPYLLGADRQDDAAFLEACRQHRDAARRPGAVEALIDDTDQLIALTRRLRSDVLENLEHHHPELAPED